MTRSILTQIGRAGAAALGFGRTHRRRIAGRNAYAVAVAAARQPTFYDSLGAPDTIEGRFDMISLHVALMMMRLRRDGDLGHDLGEAILDAMFADMDDSLRELGVGDFSIPKRVRAMGQAFQGRLRAYADVIDDDEALADALRRNALKPDAPPHAGLAIARHAQHVLAALEGVSLSDLAAGRFALPALRETENATP